MKILYVYITVILFASFRGIPGSGFGTDRYRAAMFDSVRIDSSIVYGANRTADGVILPLKADLYDAREDTSALRPLVIFIHGGGFRNGHRALSLNAIYCNYLAQCGYAAASISYRLTNDLNGNDDYFAAMLRAVEDGRAAVRFFRSNAQKYHIDTSAIIVMGSSAGAMTALHMAYLKKQDIPPRFDLERIAAADGSSGNAGVSATFQGVVNCWGALADLRWIRTGGIPVLSIHGERDAVVPADSSFAYKAFRYGSSVIDSRARSAGVPSELWIVPKVGHTLDMDKGLHREAAARIAVWISNAILDR